MSFGISNHGKYDRKLRIICDGLITTNGLLEDRVGLSRWILKLGFEILWFPRCSKAWCDLIGLTLRTTSIEMYREDFEEGSIPVCRMDASIVSQISWMKFLKGGRMWDPKILRGRIGKIPQGFKRKFFQKCRGQNELLRAGLLINLKFGDFFVNWGFFLKMATNSVPPHSPISLSSSSPYKLTQ